MWKKQEELLLQSQADIVIEKNLKCTSLKNNYTWSETNNKLSI